MQIQKQSRGDLLTLSIQGMLDNESATDFRDAIDDAVRSGWHRVVLDMSEVTYLSSAGIGVLLEARKKLERLHGLFGVCTPSPAVEQVLQQTRVLALLLCDPAKLGVAASSGTRTLHSDQQFFHDDFASYEFYSHEAQQPLRVELFGRPEGIQTETYTKSDCRRVPFPHSSFGLGLGSMGPDFETSQSRFGEFLALSGATAQSSTTTRGLPDFLLSQEDFVADVQVLYGLKCTGDFAKFIRFESHRPEEEPVGLSGLVNQVLSLTKSAAAGMVFVTECAGLVGTRLRRSPTHAVTAGTSRLEYPEVRDWLSYSTESIYHRSLALVVGIAERTDQVTPLHPARNFLRPIDPGGTLQGHFHAAVFPYRPLKKRTLELDTLVHELFSSGAIQDVLHLLHDDRAELGAGESTFVTGGCWVAPMGENTTVEVTR